MSDKDKCCGCPTDCIRVDYQTCPRGYKYEVIVAPISKNGVKYLDDWYARERPNGSFAFRFD